jgi:hypothetical protein
MRVNRRRTILSLIAAPAALFLLGAAPAGADTAAQARSAIQATYNKMNAAAAKKDAAAIIAVHDPGYTSIDKSGQKQTLSSLKVLLSQIFQVAKSIKATTTIQSCTLKGSTASVATKEHAEIVAAINPQDRTKTSTLVSDGTSQDTWVKTAKGWRLKMQKSTSMTQTVDGKPFPGR